MAGVETIWELHTLLLYFVKVDSIETHVDGMWQISEKPCTVYCESWQWLPLSGQG